MQIITITSITVLSIGILCIIGYLFFTVLSLKRKIERTKTNLVNFHKEYDNYQIDIGRTLDSLYKDLDTRFDRTNRKLDKQIKEVHKELNYVSNQKLQEEVKKCVKHIVLPADV